MHLNPPPLPASLTDAASTPTPFVTSGMDGATLMLILAIIGVMLIVGAVTAPMSVDQADPTVEADQ